MSITVVIPTVPPRRAMLAEALASVMEQTLLPDAIIVSVDRHGEGEGPTRTRGLMAVKTKWTAFLDDDDRFYPQHLERLMTTAAETKADLVYPWFDVDNGSDPLGAEGQPFDAERMMERGNFVPVTYLVKTALAKKVGGFPKPFDHDWPYQGCVDWGFHKRLVRAGAKYHHLPERTWVWVHNGHERAAARPWTEWSRS